MKYYEISDLYKMYKTKPFYKYRISLNHITRCTQWYRSWEKFCILEFKDINDKEYLRMWLEKEKSYHQHRYNIIMITVDIIITFVLTNLIFKAAEQNIIQPNVHNLIKFTVLYLLTFCIVVVLCTLVWSLFELRKIHFYDDCIYVLNTLIER